MSAWPPSGTAGITDIAPDGAGQHWPTGDRLTTNICFGGDDLRTAYITCSAGGHAGEGHVAEAGAPPAHQ